MLRPMLTKTTFDLGWCDLGAPSGRNSSPPDLTSTATSADFTPKPIRGTGLGCALRQGAESLAEPSPRAKAHTAYNVEERSVHPTSACLRSPSLPIADMVAGPPMICNEVEVASGCSVQSRAFTLACPAHQGVY